MSEEPKIQADSASNANNPKRKLIYSIIWYGLIVIVYCLLMYSVISQPPIDFYRLFEYTFFLGVILLSTILVSKDLFSKPEVRRSPLWIVLAVICWGIFIFPVVTHPPIDYTLLLAYTIVFAVCIYYQVKPTTSKRKRTSTEDKNQ